MDEFDYCNAWRFGFVEDADVWGRWGDFEAGWEFEFLLATVLDDEDGEVGDAEYGRNGLEGCGGTLGLGVGDDGVVEGASAQGVCASGAEDYGFAV